MTGPNLHALVMLCMQGLTRAMLLGDPDMRLPFHPCRLQGLLPDVVESIDLQAERVMFQLHHEADTGLQARVVCHEVLLQHFLIAKSACA